VKRVTVLGCGRVGATLARDLAADPALDVSVVDADQRNLDGIASLGVQTRRMDLGATETIASAVENCDVAVGALPSMLGFRALETVIACGKPYCDISFMAEDGLQLDAIARERSVSAVIDCGVAPGLANMMIGRCHAELDHTEDVTLYVGGLPKVRHWPYEYAAPFSPADVVEEYTRPARLIEHGRVVVKPALSDAELVDFPGIGTLEACNTDGLRSLIHTIDAVHMREKTLRYPGHFELMRVLRETGFFLKDAIDLGGQAVRPIDVTSRLLFPKWSRPDGESEFTVLRVVVAGRKAGASLRYQFDLYDETDARTGQTSMARTTAFPAAIVARMLASGTFAEPGVHPPETLCRDRRIFDQVISELAQRGVVVEEDVAGVSPS